MKVKRKKRKPSPILPHANAEAHKKVMQWLKSATTKEIFDLSVRAGIYTPDGELTERYK